MKILPLRSIAICIFMPLSAVENSLPFYAEFRATLGIVEKLHLLVNETKIDVKSVTSIKTIKECDGTMKMSLSCECYPDRNSTDQGLIAYFEEGHLTKVYTPFGSWLIFWRTLTDTQWNPVLEEFKTHCQLDKKPFTDKSGIKHEDAFAVLSLDDQSLPQALKIVQGDQSRKTILTQCIEKYLNDGGTLTELESLGKRKKRLKSFQAKDNRTKILDLLLHWRELTYKTVSLFS